MSNDLVGKRLGKYEIHAEIGKGGMGVVYQGYDRLLDRRVAIKVLAPHLVWEPGFIERFLREARSAARLKHAGIVTIYDVGQDGNWYYIVMEYLDGQTLAQMIYKQGALPSGRAITILRPLAEALDYAHGQGLIHRDVKPGNIVVNSTGQTTLTDFGVARAAQETRLTTTGALVGTPQYMSPEQAQGEELDRRTDIYSLAVVAYEMLTGQAPFGATTPHAVLHKLIYDPPPSVRSRRPELPAQVDQVLAKALAKNPVDRYDRAPDFVQALGQALAVTGQPMAASPAAAQPLAPQPAAPPRPKAAAPQAPARRRQSGWTLGLAWFLLSAVGWGLGWALAVPIGDAVIWPMGKSMDIFAVEIIGGSLSWSLVGLVLGTAQWFLLRRYVKSAGWWVVATVVGLAVVGSLKWGQGLFMEEVLFQNIFWLEDMGWGVALPLIGIGISALLEGLTGLVIGVAQWLVLQRQLEKSGRWVLFSALGWVLSSVLFGTITWFVGEGADEIGPWILWYLGGILPGAVTAIGLVWLLSYNDRMELTQQT